LFHTTPDPDVLPSNVARCSIAVDLHDEAGDLALAFPGVALPESLRGAVRKRRLEYLAGRWCAREALRVGHAHLAVHPLPPGADRAPAWPGGVVGSITHTQGFVSAAVASAAEFRGVGIDSERVFTANAALRLAGRFARPGELAALGRGGAYDEGTLAALVFSAKESLYKCLYPIVGGYFGFQVAEVVALSIGGALRVRLVEGLPGRFRAGDEFAGRAAVTATHVHTAITLRA
jgi:enterobactin synthetase component D